jgi:hypothetical protein
MRGSLKPTYRIGRLKAWEWFARYEEQAGLCGICKKSLSQAETCVDHCHATGKIRGLLCRQCNNGLGQFGDNPRNLLAAMRYLLASLDERPRAEIMRELLP